MTHLFSKLHDLLLLFLCFSMAKAALSTDNDPPISKPGCQTKCGNLTVPYPFGIGVGQDGLLCALSSHYIVTCNTTFSPAKPFIGTGNLDITEIIDTKIRIKNSVDRRCYNSQLYKAGKTWIDLREYPMVFSDTENKFTAVGCNTFAVIGGVRGQNFISGCIATCSNSSVVTDGSCSGIGCCQTAIPKGVKSYEIGLKELINDTDVFNYNPCSYGFLAEYKTFIFNVTDLNDIGFKNRTRDSVPVVLDWYIGEGQTCAVAKRNKSSYACQANTNCSEFVSGSSKGYRCSCLSGYQGNPYLGPAGCTDIDECANPKMNCCSNTCHNTGGSFYCSCPKGYSGDGMTKGSGCRMLTDPRNNSQFAIKFSLGMSFGVLICMSLIALMYFSIRRKKLIKMREKFFENNGGMLLKQQLAPYEGSEKSNGSFKIYSSDELKSITSNYSEARILGKGGYGIVYKGILEDGSAVAVKISKFVDQTQIEQFINEVAILTQINHRNVVRLKGCCLETQVPVLVYEYISNGTLFEHIHRKGGAYWLTWRNCIRLAMEAANALSYLHSAASPPIIHRDVKSSNILIDDSFKAKISDFGASRLISIDQTEVTTLVLGTRGYLDPEYFQTSVLTEKSDVYSFGVLLAELLTKQPPLCLERKVEERNLAGYFLKALKEDRLLDVLDPQLVSESDEEQLFDVAKLVKNCLSVKGEDRPTMSEVAARLEGLKNRINHPWLGQSYDDSTSLLGHQDLYPSCSSDNNPSTGEASGQNVMLVEISPLPR
ncbi:wall-associated receptor kinase 5-like [Silene latifolia]|uniref:wall-associated receptor kinase 5-like n=1 Tax=Silene latifolia TaxID=37657 RepID=UPI003D775FF8